HAADRLSFLHQLEALVDVAERHGVRDQVVDVDLLVHVPIDDLRHIRAAPGTAERRALPDPPGDQLERTGGNLLAGTGDADDDRDSPALVGAFQRLAHGLHIADAFEAVIGTALGEV